jgi:hypothetical protein
MLFLLHYGQYTIIKGKQEYYSEVIFGDQKLWRLHRQLHHSSHKPQMMGMASQWNARYKLQFLISDHLKIFSHIKWQWNLHILYELPFIFQVKTWQSEFYSHTNTEITVCIYKIYNHLADVITACRSPRNGVPVRHGNYPRRRCELLNAALKYYSLYLSYRIIKS